jgi:hypothetical protein
MNEYANVDAARRAQQGNMNEYQTNLNQQEFQQQQQNADNDLLWMTPEYQQQVQAEQDMQRQLAELTGYAPIEEPDTSIPGNIGIYPGGY